MEFRERKEIDTAKWDERVASDALENIFIYSWYLDAVSDNWGAFITKDYESILAIPYTKTLGIKKIYQPAFTREIDLLGSQFSWDDILKEITPKFKSVQFRNASPSIFENPQERKHQILKLNVPDLKYSSNANRLIKKAEKLYRFELSDNPEQLISLFKATALKKIDSISEDDLNKLDRLMNAALKLEHGELIEAYEGDRFAGAVFFLKDKKRITYLKSAGNESDKKNGAMYGLVDFAITRYKNDFEHLDFGGSDIENVANFYKKFGAEDRSYYNYNLDNLPVWYKTIKRMKG